MLTSTSLTPLTPVTPWPSGPGPEPAIGWLAVSNLASNPPARPAGLLLALVRPAGARPGSAPRAPLPVARGADGAASQRAAPPRPDGPHAPPRLGHARPGARKRTGPVNEWRNESRAIPRPAGGRRPAAPWQQSADRWRIAPAAVVSRRLGPRSCSRGHSARGGETRSGRN